MIWSFMYHRGMAHFTGHVETESEDQDTGYRVAVAWCEKNGMRPPATVQPFILATERILIGTPAVEPVAVPDVKLGVVASVKGALGL